MKRSDFSDAEFGQHLQQRWDALASAHAGGMTDEHPALGYNRDSAALRRVARDTPGNIGEAKEIEFTDHTADDPPPTPGSAGLPARPGASLARGMDSIPGYDRLRSNGRDSTRTVDKDGIVKRKPLSGYAPEVDADGIVQSKRSW